MTLSQLSALAAAAAQEPPIDCGCRDDYGPVAPYCDRHTAQHDALNALGAATPPGVIAALVRVAEAAKAAAEAANVCDDDHDEYACARDSCTTIRALREALSALESVG